MITLFPDQRDSIEAVLAEMRGGCKAVLLQGVTGSGKTVIGSEIIRRSQTKNKRVVFCVPRRDLVRQLIDTFDNFGIRHGVLCAGYYFDPRPLVHIVSLETLKRRIDAIHVPDLMFVDETHFGSNGLDTIIKYFKARGTWFIGLSATPWKLSGQGLGCWYDRMVCGPSVSDLIKLKRLSEYKAYTTGVPDLSQIKVTAGDYAKGQLAEKMEGDRVLIGNAAEHYIKYAMGKLGVTFAVSRKHSEMLAQEYRDRGVPAMYIDGETPENDRRKIARAFAKRELLQLCNAELLTFGYDLASASGIPGVCIEAISDCQPTKSLAKIMQKWGRGLRYDGMPHPFLDHSGNFIEHGLPDDDREWTLQDREKKPTSEKTIPVRQCPPPCGFTHRPSPNCPACGYTYPIQYREIEVEPGELIEIERQQAKVKRMEVGKCKTQDDLERVAEERGYHWGWVKRQCGFKNIPYKRRALSR